MPNVESDSSGRVRRTTDVFRSMTYTHGPQVGVESARAQVRRVLPCLKQIGAQRPYAPGCDPHSKRGVEALSAPVPCARALAELFAREHPLGLQGPHQIVDPRTRHGWRPSLASALISEV